ncbi:MAG: hypothetical protein KC620_10690, partial [Myxococcales bacterium]|nr:hypothetical protein [Myxococcales bacterium]
MLVRYAVLFVSLLAVVGCDDGEEGADGAPPVVIIVDSAVDGPVADQALPDAAQPDAVADALPPDAAPDAVVDAVLDAEPDMKPDAAPPPACFDGLDNDGDGAIDYPLDPGCSSLDDDDEIDPDVAACADGLDNDDDGRVDFPEDPGCAAA